MAFSQSCARLASDPMWEKPCQDFPREAMPEAQKKYLERFFEARALWRVKLTGYYEPVFSGRRKKTEDFIHPLLAPPQDLLKAELGNFDPLLAGKAIFGRLVGGELLPYFPREDIEKGKVEALPIAWLDNALDLFTLQVQGSGILEFPREGRVRFSFAASNGRPFVPLSRILAEENGLFDKAAKKDLRAWARAHPKKLEALLWRNPRYIFFRESKGANGPLGTLGVALTPGRSVAVDPQRIPLGTLLYLAPEEGPAPAGIVLAQDTGAAILGHAVDYFWGTGDEAQNMALDTYTWAQVWEVAPKPLAVATSRP